jgi:hypothetical protein
MVQPGAVTNGRKETRSADLAFVPNIHWRWHVRWHLAKIRHLGVRCVVRNGAGARVWGEREWGVGLTTHLDGGRAGWQMGPNLGERYELASMRRRCQPQLIDCWLAPAQFTPFTGVNRSRGCDRASKSRTSRHECQGQGPTD